MRQSLKFADRLIFAKLVPVRVYQIETSHPPSDQYATLGRGHRDVWLAHGWNHWDVIPYTPYLPSLEVTGSSRKTRAK